MKILAAMMVLVLVGCGEELDQGSLAAAGLTERDQAQVVGWAACELLGRCNGFTALEVEECADNYVAAVCGSYDCDAPMQVSEAALSQCLEDLDAHTCDPSPVPSCAGILR